MACEALDCWSKNTTSKIVKQPNRAGIISAAKFQGINLSCKIYTVKNMCQKFYSDLKII